MPKQLILLAGLHKTATTSIQRTCMLNAGLLKDAGFDYPEVQGDDRSVGNHTRFLNKLFKTDPGRGGLLGQFVLDAGSPLDDERANRRRRFARALQGVERVVMAAEGVSTFSFDELAGMREWFEREGWTIRLLCQVRHLDSWTNSMVAQRVVSAYRLPIERAVGEFTAYGSLVQRRIENLRTAFPEAEFQSHELAVQHSGGPVGAFFDWIGFRAPSGLRMMQARTGMSDRAARVLSLINERFGPFAATGQPSPDAFDDPSVTRLVRKIEGRKFWLREQEASALLPLMKAENEWLGRELGAQYLAQGLRFNNEPVDWTPEDLTQLRQALEAMPPQVRSWVVAHQSRLGIAANWQ